METIQHLAALGKEILSVEEIYLDLKIEKALSGEEFDKEPELAEAEVLWKEINQEYVTFIDYLQNNKRTAA